MKLEEINIKNMKIETARLILRPFEMRDLDDLYDYASTPGVGEAAGWKHHETKEESQSVLNVFIAEERVFAIEEKESGKVIGSISLGQSADVYNDVGIGKNINDVGYVLGQKYWGKGYATEAVRGILSYAFYILHLDAVTCGHFKDNESSKKVIEQCGFKHVVDGKYTVGNGAAYDASFYAITHIEYGVDYRD